MNQEQQISENYRPTVEEPYMCPGQLAYFRQKLLSWRQKALQELQESGDRLREERGREGDLADQGVREVDMMLDLKTRERCRNLIEKIDSALSRMEDGSYGFCEETGEEIGLKRLEARPFATLSIEAQERMERLSKLQRHPSA